MPEEIDKIDGHIHLHRSREDSKADPTRDIYRIKDLAKENGVEELLGIFREKDLGSVEALLRDEDIHPGIYVRMGDYSKESLKRLRDKFEFAKIHSSRVSPTSFIERLDGVVEDCIDAGYRRIQVHTDRISEDFIQTLEDYINKEDSKFYLAHGGNAFSTSGYSSASPEEIKDLRGDLFLGTSPISKTIVPGYLDESIENGLGDILTYGSDFTPRDREFFYKASVEHVGGLPLDKGKVFHENTKDFLD